MEINVQEIGVCDFDLQKPRRYDLIWEFKNCEAVCDLLIIIM